MMSGGHMTLFNGMSMTRASSNDSLASDFIDPDDDHQGLISRQVDIGGIQQNETGSITQSNTPTGSFCNSESPNIISQNQEFPLDQRHQQHSAELNLANGSKNKKLFPQKLWDLINDERYNFCLRWSEDGMLVYLNRDEFEESYLKTAENQFHTQKAISFVRQMNMYGFRKVDDCYYENDNFKRGCEHLLKNMIRKHPNKGTNSRGLDLGPQISMNTGLNDYRQRLRLTGTERITQSGNVFNQIVDSDCSNEDSVSSYGDQCCNDQVAPKHQQHCADPTSEDALTHDGRFHNVESVSNKNAQAVYALLSSLNTNLYQAGTPQQQQLGASTHSTDLEHFMNLQQLYQQILNSQTNNRVPVSSAQPTVEIFAKNSTPASQINFDHQAINYSSPNNRSRDISSRSMLSGDNMRMEQTDQLARRECNPIRSFKRSANSILESRTPTKRNKNDFSQELDVNEVVTSSYARGLVTRIALSRDPNIEADVVEEASKYTERFVETLFDTAQILARHDIDGDRTAIKASNLASAIRLLPSKLSKIIN